RGIYAWRSGFVAPRDGEKESGGNGQTTGYLRERLCEGEQHPGGEGESSFRFAGKICGLRIQQISRRSVCDCCVSDRLPEGELPGGISLRDDDQRHVRHGKTE